jgi:hypothetical protein
MFYFDRVDLLSNSVLVDKKVVRVDVGDERAVRILYQQLDGDQVPSRIEMDFGPLLSLLALEER